MDNHDHIDNHHNYGETSSISLYLVHNIPGGLISTISNSRLLLVALPSGLLVRLAWVMRANDNKKHKNTHGGIAYQVSDRGHVRSDHESKMSGQRSSIY